LLYLINFCLRSTHMGLFYHRCRKTVSISVDGDGKIGPYGWTSDKN